MSYNIVNSNGKLVRISGNSKNGKDKQIMVNSNNYSLSEILVGKWIDNRPIYRIVIPSEEYIPQISKDLIIKYNNVGGYTIIDYIKEGDKVIIDLT